MLKQAKIPAPDAAPFHQKGAVMVLFVAGMLAILALAGLALDGSHQMLNKARLQNGVDASSLAGAKILDKTSDTAQADAAARLMFANNANDAGNREMNNAPIDITVQFSATVNPFVPGSYVPGSESKGYVRVAATGFTMPAWLIQVLGFNDKTVAASAVAGPTPPLVCSCNVVPIIACGNLDEDPAQSSSTSFWGYDRGNVHVLKEAPGGNPPPPLGPGNFNFAAIDGSSSGAAVRDALAGGYDECICIGDDQGSAPGNKEGPTQGINTRLNIYGGPIKPGDYPPDVIVTQQDTRLSSSEDGSQIFLDGLEISSSDELDFNYENYTDQLTDEASWLPGGEVERRMLPIIMGDCSNPGGGSHDVPVIGFGCFFLLQETTQGAGGGGGKQALEIFGEFVKDCGIEGSSANTEIDVPGPHKIVLYNDTMSKDS